MVAIKKSWLQSAEAVPSADANALRSVYYWTTPEIAALRQLCEANSLTVGDVSAALPTRSLPAIRTKAIELDLQLPRVCGATPSVQDMRVLLRDELPNPCTTSDIRQLAEKIGAPAWWVSRMADQFGVSRERLKPSKWTEPEFDLVQRWGDEGLDIVCKKLKAQGFHRTTSAVLIAMKRLGWSTARRTALSARAAARILGVSDKVVASWIRAGLLKAGRQHGSWSIERQELRRFSEKGCG